MFIHVKEPQFEVKVSRIDPAFATLLQEQFGGANGELSAAMQYFTQALGLRRKHPGLYDMLMDIATEELAHLEMVGLLITRLLEGLPEELEKAEQQCDWLNQVQKDNRDALVHTALTNPLFLAHSGGGPAVCNAAGAPWTGAYVNAQGDPSVDLRTNIGAESRAKITYEYLKQFTQDPGVQDVLTFLMTREIAHQQQFTAALDSLKENFPPGKVPGDERFVALSFNMSDGQADPRGPWNEGQGPWPLGVQWEHIENPQETWLSDPRRCNQGFERAPHGEPHIKSVSLYTHQAHVLLAREPDSQTLQG